MEQLTCTVIGGTGTIGRALINALPDQWRLRVVSRTGSQLPFRPGLENVVADVSDARAIHRVVKGSDVVFLLTTAATEDPDDLALDIVAGARNVAAACIAHSVRRVVFASSIAALFLGGKRVITEQDGVDSKPQYRNYYARYKIAAERLFEQEHKAKGLPVVIIRPGMVLGVGCSPTHGGFGNWVSDLCCLGFGSGDNPLPLVLIQDVVQALVAASTAPAIEGQSFNVAGDVELSAREFISILAERSRRRYRYLPYTTARRWQHIGKWGLKLVNQKYANRFPWKRDLASMACISSLNCSAAKRALNWTPNRNLDHFLAEAVDSHLPVISSLDLRLRYRLAAEGS